MKVFANLVIITTEFCDKSFNVLSMKEDELILPSLEITNENKNLVPQLCYNKILEFIPTVHELEIIPQITTHHCNVIDNDEDRLNMIFGYLVTHVETTSECSWFSIHYKDNKHKYIPTIFEVIQRLR